jgi:hypothetical protein
VEASYAFVFVNEASLERCGNKCVPVRASLLHCLVK